MPSLGRRPGPSRGCLELVGTRRWSSPGATQRAPGAAVPQPPEASPATGPSPCIPEGTLARAGGPLGAPLRTRSQGAAAQFKPRDPAR